MVLMTTRCRGRSSSSLGTLIIIAFTKVSLLLVLTIIISSVEIEGGVVTNSGQHNNTSKFCGKIRTNSGRTVSLYDGKSLTPLEFQKAKNLWRAKFEPAKDCSINVCGHANYGPGNSYRDCELITKSTTADDQIYNENFTASSLSCGCQKRDHDCMYTCETRESVLEESGWGNGSCAVLYEERGCNSCYFPPINVSDGHNFVTDNSHQVISLIVRDDCVVKQEIPGFAKAKLENSIIPYHGWTDPTESAFQSDHPETFQCTCVGEVEPRDGELNGSTEKIIYPVRGSSYAGVIAGSVVGVLVIAAVVSLFLWKVRPFSTMTLFKLHQNGEMGTSSSAVSNVEFFPNTRIDNMEMGLGNFNDAQQKGSDDDEDDDDETGTEFSRDVLGSSCMSDDPVPGSSNLKTEILDGVKTLLETFFVTLGSDKDENAWSYNESIRVSDFESISLEFSNVCSSEHEIPRTAFMVLNQEKPLGSGKFGTVYKGVLKSAGDGLWEKQIAVKKMQLKVGKSFLREIRNFQSVVVNGIRNENIVRFIGACCDRDGLFLLTELCEGGSLETHLVENMRPRILGDVPPCLDFIEAEQNYFITDAIAEKLWIEQRDQCSLEKDDLHQLLVWCQQIAAGMQYLHETVEMLHVDLAIRNVLLRDGQAKLADFGLSRKCLGKEYFAQYVLNGDLPFNSLAPELLGQTNLNSGLGAVQYPSSSTSVSRSRNAEKVTLFLDVWAYGCLIWQMFTMGEGLYPNVKANGLQRCAEISVLLANGYRHSHPRLAPIYVCNQITECWNQNPENRPRFSELQKFFADRVNENKKTN